MVRISFLSILFFIQFTSYSQTFSPERVTAWENAGLTTELQAPQNQVSVIDFGADNTGQANCSVAVADAITSLNGNAGTIYFPAGEYFFSSGISIPDSVFLKGESSETELIFDLDGSGDLIRLNGTISPTQYTIVSATKGSYELELSDATGLEIGDIVRLYQFDEDYMFSSWAYGTLGQVVKISAIDDNTLTLTDPLNHHYPLSRNPYCKKLNPRTGAGIECLKIVREDATTGQTDNVVLNYAYNCVVRNVEIENSNFAHVSINSSAHIQIEGCYLHHAHAYGGGGQGYGVVTQYATSFCLTQNNIFEHLRHSMLIQAGANGNVFGYNYSYDPYWESGFLPTNSAGDAVLHGNYTYMNLFEGNTVQHMVIDASHGSNGPYNTFFRNRGELYGFFSDSGTPSDSMNVVGNVITNSGFPYGLFMLNGVGHYSYGNNHSGSVTPSNTSNMTVNTLYLNENDLPAFLNQEILPMVGYPLAMNQKLLQAEQRFISEEYVDCENMITSSEASVKTQNDAFTITGNTIETVPSALPAVLSIYSTNGALIKQRTLTSTKEMFSLPYRNEMLLIQVRSRNGYACTSFKHVGLK